MLAPSAIPGMDADTSGAIPYIVVCESDYGGVGVPVERAVRIVETSDGAISPAPPGTEPEMFSQAFFWRDKPYPLLDIDTLLAQLPYQYEFE